MGKSSGQKPLFDEDAAINFLTDWKIRLRLNLISREIEIDGLPDFFREDRLNNFFTWSFDEVRHDFSVSRQHADDLFRLLACKSAYNPIAEILRNVPLDVNSDHLSELFQIMNIPTSDSLSRTLIKKACLQAIALAYNKTDTPQGADGILVLCGKQGIGKTSIVAQLGINPSLFRLGLNIDFKDKDTVYRAVTTFLGEIAEIESTLRSDPERLKAFITNPIDEIRLPYARYSTKLPRRASFFGTCNSEDFLCDPTGSRRFWVIPLEKIDLAGLKEFDTLAFWKEMEYRFLNEDLAGRGNTCFRLTAAEQEALRERNSNYQKALPAQLEVSDILHTSLGGNEFKWVYTTTSEFKSCFEVLKPYSVQKIAKALDALGIEQVRRRVNGVACRVRLLPLPKYVATRWNSAAVNEVNEA